MLRTIIEDGIGAIGAGALVYGVWQIYPPAGWIAGGMIGLVLAFGFARLRPE